MLSPNELNGAPRWPREYEEFVRLFNERDFYESHEVLEDLWVLEVEPLKNYYKGLIQAAVALCHWERGNCSGARKLYWSASQYLAPYPAVYEGLELGRLMAVMRELFAPLVAAPEATGLPAPERTRIPLLELRPDHE